MNRIITIGIAVALSVVAVAAAKKTKLGAQYL